MVKSKEKADYTSKDFYKYFKDKNPHIKLSKSEYVKILKEYFDRVIDLMIHKSLLFSFPGKLGFVKIAQFKVKPKLMENGSLDKRRLRVNWEATKKLWKRIYPDKTWEDVVACKDKPVVFHENKHSNGFSHKWFWDKSTAAVANIGVYSLKISRTNCRKLAKALKTPGIELYYHTL